MATVGHLIAGMVIGRAYGPGTTREVSLRMAGCAVLAALPDLDLVFFHVRHPGPYAHRGFTHSLGAALACGLALGLLAAAWPKTRGFAVKLGLFVALAVASHGLLDMFSDRGSAVAYFWPLSDTRVVPSFRPIPVARFSPRWLFVTSEAKEFLAFSPALAFALWPRRRSRQQAPP